MLSVNVRVPRFIAGQYLSVNRLDISAVDYGFCFLG